MIGAWLAKRTPVVVITLLALSLLATRQQLFSIRVQWKPAQTFSLLAQPTGTSTSTAAAASTDQPESSHPTPSTTPKRIQVPSRPQPPGDGQTGKQKESELTKKLNMYAGQSIEQNSIGNLMLKIDAFKYSSYNFSQFRELYHLPPMGSPQCREALKAKSGPFTFSQKAVDDELARLRAKPFLPKTVFGGRPIVVFIAGLEGTGHHFMKTALTSLCRSRGQPSSVCSPFSGYSRAMRSLTGKGWHLLPTMLQRNPKAQTTLLAALQTYGTAHPVAFLNTDTGEAMFSYPNGGTVWPERPVSNPDVRELAEMFQDAGYDFRILLLSRNPESLVMSTTTHRKFVTNLEYQGDVYTRVSEVFLAQLAGLDERFLAGSINIEDDRPTFDTRLQLISQSLEIPLDKLKTASSSWRPSLKRRCLDTTHGQFFQSDLQSLTTFFAQYSPIENIANHITLRTSIKHNNHTGKGNLSTHY